MKCSIATVASRGNEGFYVDGSLPYDAESPALQMQEVSKLGVLRQQDLTRTWQSLEDQRVCVLCGNEFCGKDVHIQTDHGQVTCHCPTPGCNGEVRHFVFPGNPLLDPKVWSDWMLALGSADHHDSSAEV